MSRNKMNDEQERDFNALANELAVALGSTYRFEQGSFMNEGLRYMETYIRPMNSTATRKCVCRDVERAIVALGKEIHHSRQGASPYMTDDYHIGSVVVGVANARSGGKIVTFNFV